MKDKNREPHSAFLRISATALLMLALMAACFPPQGPAGPSIRVTDPWARPAQMMAGAMKSETGMESHGAAGNSAIYMTLYNDGQEPDRLIAAQADVAAVIEIHETRMEGDVMKMQPVQGGIEAPARGQVELKPGGYHVMLIGLTQDLNPGDRFPVTLQFEKSGALTLEVEVRQP